MPLKAVVSTLDELAEPLRQFYTKSDDGKYRLDAEGVEDVTGLKSALGKERERADTVDRELKALRKKFEKITDPEKAAEALDKIRELEEKQLIDAGKLEEVVTQRTERMRADHDNQLTAFKTKETELTEKLTKTATRLKEVTLHGDIRKLAGERGIRPEAVDDAIARLTHLGIDGVKWDMRDDAVVALRGEAIAYGKDPAKPMSLVEGFDLLAQKAPHLFAQSKGTGAQNSGGSGNGGTIALTQEQSKNVVLYRQAQEQAAKTGASIVISD